MARPSEAGPHCGRRLPQEHWDYWAPWVAQAPTVCGVLCYRVRCGDGPFDLLHRDAPILRLGPRQEEQEGGVPSQGLGLPPEEPCPEAL